MVENNPTSDANNVQNSVDNDGVLVDYLSPPKSQDTTTPVNDDDSQESGTTEDTKEEDNLKVGAGVAGGTIGFVVGGPFVALLLGFGSAYATETPGATGDVARALGETALVASQKFKKVNEEHQLVERSQVALEDSWERIKEYDRRHNVLEKSKGFVVYTWENVKEINARYKLLERAIEGIGRAVAFLASKLAQHVNPRNDSSIADDDAAH